MKKIIILISSLFTVNVYSQSVEDYINIAKQNNSKIKVQNALVNLEKEKSDEVASYENTTFNTGIFALTPETRVGSQLFKVGASQQLPWFGELEAKRDLVTAKANIKQYDVALSEKQIEFEVSKAYYQI